MALHVRQPGGRGWSELADVPRDDPVRTDAERFLAERRDERRVKGHDLDLAAKLNAPPGLADRIGCSGLVVHDEGDSRISLDVAELLAPCQRRATDVDGSSVSVHPEGYRWDLGRPIWPDGRQASQRMLGQILVLGIGKDHASSLQLQPQLRSSPCGMNGAGATVRETTSR